MKNKVQEICGKRSVRRGHIAVFFYEDIVQDYIKQGGGHCSEHYEFRFLEVIFNPGGEIVKERKKSAGNKRNNTVDRIGIRFCP